MDWDTFWATFSQTHLVTLRPPDPPQEQMVIVGSNPGRSRIIFLGKNMSMLLLKIDIWVLQIFRPMPLFSSRHTNNAYQVDHTQQHCCVFNKNILAGFDPGSFVPKLMRRPLRHAAQG
jgi:hypothetical protein